MFCCRLHLKGHIFGHIQKKREQGVVGKLQGRTKFLCIINNNRFGQDRTGRLLRVPWTARTSNQSILKEISSEYSLEGLMLKVKLQYFGHLMRRADSLEKTFILRQIEGSRRRGQKRRRWLDGITDSMDMSLSKLRW